MTSYPPAPENKTLGLRPRYLVVAMVITWFVGVQGLTSGLHTAAFLRRGTTPVVDIEAAATRPEVIEATRLKALGEIPDVAFPLSVAQILLGGLLVVSSGLAMGGRKGARSLALQAICAHVAFAAVDYALTRHVRFAVHEAIDRAAIDLGDKQREAFIALGPWRERVAELVFHGATMALGAFALTRARTKAFFAAVARATERAEEDS